MPRTRCSWVLLRRVASTTDTTDSSITTDATDNADTTDTTRLRLAGPTWHCGSHRIRVCAVGHALDPATRMVWSVWFCSGFSPLTQFPEDSGAHNGQHTPTPGMTGTPSNVSSLSTQSTPRNPDTLSTTSNKQFDNLTLRQGKDFIPKPMSLTETD
mmetsp:Transcript_49291/g.88025  ORF Transcript_49291/g.88025 Transcript_49291/m.88025 type:complete len:156 (-) Transcript_49291:2184-2651(-)